MGIDKIVRLNFAPFSKVYIGNKSILDYRLILANKEKKLILKGLKPGESSVVVLDKKTGDVKMNLIVTVSKK